MRSRASVLCATLVAFSLAPVHIAAAQQVQPEPERLYMSRADLTALLVFYEQSSASPVYGERLKARAALEGDVVRSRLEEGDFRVGDRVVVTLESQGVTDLDTLIVEEGRVVRFPELGDVDLSGVLRSELRSALQGFIERYVREPRLQSRSLVRIQLSGAVARPGFYTMPSEIPLPDAIMMAGGPEGDVDLNGIRVERRGRKILSGEAIQDALAEGRTLDQLSLRGGDQIVVPQRFSLGGGESALRSLGYLLSLPFSVAALLALVL